MEAACYSGKNTGFEVRNSGSEAKLNQSHAV